MVRAVEVNSPPSLLASWLEYRKATREQSRADVIREINQALDRRFNNTSMYRWLHFKHSVPEEVVAHFIEPELPLVLRWVFVEQGFPTKNVNFNVLAAAVRPTLKYPSKT